MFNFSSARLAALAFAALIACTMLVTAAEDRSDRPKIGASCQTEGNYRCTKRDPGLTGDNAWQSNALVNCRPWTTGDPLKWQPYTPGIACIGSGWTCEEKEDEGSTSDKPKFSARCVGKGRENPDWMNQVKRLKKRLLFMA